MIVELVSVLSAGQIRSGKLLIIILKATFLKTKHLVPEITLLTPIWKNIPRSKLKTMLHSFKKTNYNTLTNKLRLQSVHIFIKKSISCIRFLIHFRLISVISLLHSATHVQSGNFIKYTNQVPKFNSNMCKLASSTTWLVKEVSISISKNNNFDYKK